MESQDEWYKSLDSELDLKEAMKINYIELYHK